MNMETRAAVVYEANTPMVIEKLDVESPKRNEILVKYKAAGLCHSDLSVMNGLLPVPLPMIPGHEGAGIVQEVGPGVTKVKPGDHVVLAWVPVCGRCYFCLKGQPYLCMSKDKTRGGTMLDGTYRLKKGDLNIGKMLGVGSFSEYNVVNEENVVKIDQDIPFDVAAVVGCAAMTGVGAAINTAKVKWGSTVVVLGIGGVGLYVTQGAALSHASKIIAVDVLDNKLEFAKRFGATHLINATRENPVERVLEITDGIGADYAFEVLGKPETARSTINMIRRGGSAVIVGLPGGDATITVPLWEFALQEKNLLGCYYGSSDARTDLSMLLSLYKSGHLNVNDTITQRYTLDEINQGFADMEAGKNIRGVVMM